MILNFIIIIAGIVVDQISKWLAVVHLKGNLSFPLWEGVLHFTYLENTGAAFGILKGNRWVFMSVSIIAIAGMLLFLIKYRPKNKLIAISISLIISGGIGNMIDRILLGYVVDFIDFALINFAIFNLADSWVCIGAALLIIYMIFHKEGEPDKEDKQGDAFKIQ